VKKASVDPEFRKILLEKRAESAGEIDLEMSQAEKDMLAGIPSEQLEKIIDNTKVAPEHRSVFLSSAGKLMLTVLVGAAVVAILCPTLGHTKSISPEMLKKIQEQKEQAAKQEADEQGQGLDGQDEQGQKDDSDAIIRGIRPDRPDAGE